MLKEVRVVLGQKEKVGQGNCTLGMEASNEGQLPKTFLAFPYAVGAEGLGEQLGYLLSFGREIRKAVVNVAHVLGAWLMLVCTKSSKL